MSYVGEIYPAEELAETNWSRIHLFYTLFTTVAHCLFGLKGAEKIDRPKITITNISKIRFTLDDISEKFDRYTEAGRSSSEIPKNYVDFINYSRRGTTDTGARFARSAFVCGRIKEALA